jgi:hypothetical protein
MSADANQLLFAISARGKMTWGQYREAIAILLEGLSGHQGGAGEAASHVSLLQALQGLGHCDVDFTNEGSVISITQAALCRLPSGGLPKAVLTGARSLDTIKQIREAALGFGKEILVTVLRESAPSGLIPDSVFIEAASERTLGEYAEVLGVQYIGIPPAWTLVNWSGDIDEIGQALDYRVSQDLNWPRFDFRPYELFFSRERYDSFPRLTRYINDATKMPMHVIYCDDRGAEIDLNWGRYMLFKLLSLNITAYDEKSLKLAVPLKAQLPTVIARALCLCTGLPAIHLNREGLVPQIRCSDWIVYDGIPPQIAVTALSKIGQAPIMKQILG